MNGLRQADDLFVCFGAKPNKGLSSRSSTRPEVGKGTLESCLEKELREGSEQGNAREGSLEKGT